MDSKNQFTFFCLCLCIGFIGAVLYEFFALFRLLFGCDRGKNAVLGIVLDLIFCACFACFCVFGAFWLKFPDFRVYMPVGYAVGGILYSKTLRRIVAIFEKVCYNRITKLVRKARKHEKTLKKEVEIEI